MSGDDIVRVLVVTPAEEDRVALHHVFSHSNWQMDSVRTCSEARDFLHAKRAAVVICAAELPDGSWKSLLDDAARIPTPPRLIVAHHAPDDQFWADVLDQGAYDVLGKPFEREEVIRVVSLAWRQWRFEGARAAASEVGATDIRRAGR